MRRESNHRIGKRSKRRHQGSRRRKSPQLSERGMLTEFRYADIPELFGAVNGTVGQLFTAFAEHGLDRCQCMACKEQSSDYFRKTDVLALVRVNNCPRGTTVLIHYDHLDRSIHTPLCVRRRQGDVQKKFGIEISDGAVTCNRPALAQCHQPSSVSPTASVLH